ncbi:MAG: A/G-specific adenine glycosylase [Burkholderiaceae bacterium]
MKRLARAVPGDEAGLEDPSFSDAVIRWQQDHGRHALPWQNTRDAYRVWLSEIMLQQTQVAAVIPYYRRFLERFPDVRALAAAPAEDVMAHWSGLGYYSRARNLHRCAQRIVAEYGGEFPSDPALLTELPGIGRSTAAAIAAFSGGTRAAILDGNVKRVFARVFGIGGYPGERRIEGALWRRAEALLPKEGGIEAYTQGLMDLGATVCTRGRPACTRCPLASRCIALATGRTAQLPVRKPKKTVPEKTVAMLVVAGDGEVLLQRRPGSGIWGGLLSLPEVLPGVFPDMPSGAPVAPVTEAAMRLCAPFGEIASIEPLMPFSHGFTHVRLHVDPWLVRLTERRPHVAGGDLVWQRVDALEAAPLPAPVKKLLTGLFAPGDLFADAARD